MLTPFQTQGADLLNRGISGRRDFLRVCAAGLALPFVVNRPSRATSSHGKKRIAAGLELGTLKVRVAVGEQRQDGTVEILGIGKAPANILRHGVLDSEMVSERVREALIQAEIQTDVVIGSLAFALGGNYRGSVCPHPFTADDSEEMCFCGKRNEAFRTIGSACAGAEEGYCLFRGNGVKWRIRAVESVGVSVNGVVLLPAATAEAVLDAEQKNHGALVVDIGAERASFAAYSGGKLKRVASSPFRWDASAPPVEDFSRMLCALGSIARIYTLIQRECPVESLGSGAHLTGGCSTLPGVLESAQDYFRKYGISVELGRIKGVSGRSDVIEDPRNATAIGLVKATFVEG